MNLTTLPDLRAQQAPTAPAIADDTIDMNNAEFLDAVRRASATLVNNGVQAGDVVAIMLPNHTGFVVALFAAWRLGAAATPISPTLVPAEIGYQVKDAGARVVIVDTAPNYDLPTQVVLTAELTADDAQPGQTCAEHDNDALALLIYTSGTTGRPKGVMLDHANLNAMCRMAVDAFAMSENDHSLLILPLFHANGIIVGALSALVAGGRITIAGRFSPHTFFDRLERCRATYFSAVPTIYTMLADLPDEFKPDTSSVRFAICGAAPASVGLLSKFENRYGIPLIEGYGLSEGTCASTANPLNGARKPGTVGLALPGQEIRIVGADHRTVAPGETGEVAIKGPNVMRGYLNRPDETAKTIIDGWLHTGDVGRLDKDGYLILVDRAKDMIIRGGENIYPKEIESVAYQLPEIAEAAVIGRPSELYGEEPVLYVSLNSGKDITADRIREHLRNSLSKFKRPVDITVLDELPKNAVGKLDKPTLRKSLATERSGT
ncbi:class I adenylate-forming enzyme family protein [Mycobacterium spongiae]|uniref:Long-chain-fatty-acid--CoA ligase FadD13 n=1 Tax=Mycobacterium spongiae TaxID=886343 RepID=A0A975JUT8_9MYCO|nr:AMP-binding protein [Mycobacterium spongiae]QUR66099.1 AMP-binding protein [Mycobacterium spongiae]